METSPAMHIDPAIFRAYDIRGTVTEQLTPQVVRAIGHSFGSECAARGQRQVVVARDGRLSGPALIAALTDGLRAAGREVIDIGMLPTPLLYFATHQLGTGTGVMITGSHNPPQYNGLKMVLDGGALYGEQITALHDRLLRGELHHEAGGARREQRVEADYLARVTGDVRLVRPLRIAVDCGNGVPGVIAPELFRALGCEVVELHSEVDGNFPNHHPDPAKPENLADVIAAVAEHGLDLGLAFDGDGDRVGVVCNEGRVLWPDRQMILYAADVLSRNPGAKIIYDVKCSRHLPAAIRRCGGEAEMWKTGHSLVKARMRETGALLGGEMSGHIFFKERWYGFDDALYVAARLLEILARDPRPAAEVFAALPDSHNTPELHLHFTGEGEQHDFMDRFVAATRFDDAKLHTIDGLRADFADGFGLVRASNTTASLVIRFEADDAAALARIQSDFRAAMRAVDDGLEPPF